MTNIKVLISATIKSLPFSSPDAAQVFLSTYSEADQAAIITALYVGRDHIHSDKFHSDYVPEGLPYDRFFTTGDSKNWLIPPSNWARILYEKGNNLNLYFEAFLRCSPNLTTF